MKSPGTPVVLSGELPEFADIDDALWQDAVAASAIVHCPAGAVAPEWRSTASAFFIVLQGRLKVYGTGVNGREITIYHVKEKGVCMHSLVSLLGCPTHGVQAVAEDDSRILAIPAEYFYHLLVESDSFRRYVMGALARCITNVSEQVAEVSFEPLDVRLARFLQQRSGDPTADTLRITHQAIANEIGTTREVVSRLLKAFEEAGYVKLGRARIEIISLGALCTPCKSA